MKLLNRGLISTLLQKNPCRLLCQYLADINSFGLLQMKLDYSVLNAPHLSTKQKIVMICSSGVVNSHLKLLYQLIKNMVLSLQLQNKLIKIIKTMPRKLHLVPEIILSPETVLIILQDLVVNQSPM